MIDLRYSKPEDFLDIAAAIIRRSEFRVADDDLQSLAESLTERVSEWFGDTKHLTRKFPQPTKAASRG